MIKWFREKLDCSLSHCPNPHPGISMGSDEDDRNTAFLVFKPGLQVQPRHLRHANINDQARGLTMQTGFKEFFRGSKALCLVPSRFDQILQGILHRLLVIDDRNQLGFLLPRHRPRLARRHHSGQPNFRLAELDFRIFDPDWRERRSRQTLIYILDLSRSAILTRSGNDSACIFFITWLRCILIVASLASSSAAICLLSIPQTTRFITSRSRTLNVLYRSRSSAISRCFSQLTRSRVSDR